jgi:hypothetical protein
MVTADYWVDFSCRRGGRRFAFKAFMFVTEVPLDPSRGDAHQVSVEVGDVGGEYEEALAAVMLFRPSRRELVLDRVQPDAFAAAEPIKERRAEDVREALVAAVEMALAAWNAKAWDALAAE